MAGAICRSRNRTYPAELCVLRAENHATGGGGGVDDAPGQWAARHMSSLITASIVSSSSRHRRRNLIPPVQPGASTDRKLEKASMARAHVCSGTASRASWTETAAAAAAGGGGWMGCGERREASPPPLPGLVLRADVSAPTDRSTER